MKDIKAIDRLLTTSQRSERTAASHQAQVSKPRRRIPEMGDGEERERRGQQVLVSGQLRAALLGQMCGPRMPSWVCSWRQRPTTHLSLVLTSPPQPRKHFEPFAHRRCVSMPWPQAAGASNVGLAVWSCILEVERLLSFPKGSRTQSWGIRQQWWWTSDPTKLSHRSAHAGGRRDPMEAPGTQISHSSRRKAAVHLAPFS